MINAESAQFTSFYRKLATFPAMFTNVYFKLLYLNNYSIYVASALLGLGGPIIWTAQGTFLANNSKPETITRHHHFCLPS